MERGRNGAAHRHVSSKKPAVAILPGQRGPGGFAEVDDRVVGELGKLERIGAVGVLAEIDAAVEHDVAGGVERIREDEDRGVVGGVVGLAAEGESLRRPT
jgi:hypothetical protein